MDILNSQKLDFTRNIRVVSFQNQTSDLVEEYLPDADRIYSIMDEFDIHQKFLFNTKTKILKFSSKGKVFVKYFVNTQYLRDKNIDIILQILPQSP